MSHDKERIDSIVKSLEGEKSDKLKQGVVLYMGINPEKKRKACTNCMMYLKDVHNCSIHGESVWIGPHMVCGLYVNGKPMTEKEHGPAMPLVTTKESGLIGVVSEVEGTSCNICVNFKAPRKCEIVEGDVEGLGCCNAWENNELEISWKEFQE